MSSNSEDDRRSLPVPVQSYQVDVKVFVGKDEDQSEHFFHGHELASISPWMDERLLEQMECEEETKKEYFELFLEDIPTDTWLDMINFVLSPAAVRQMTKEDVMRVVAGYHKYEINLGLEVCDLVLEEYLGSLENQILGSTLDQEFMVSAIFTAAQFNLVQAIEAGLAFLARLFRRQIPDAHPSNLSPANIKVLAPILVEIAEKDEGFLQQLLPFHCKTLSMSSAEDIKDDSFPALFCMEWQLHKAGQHLRETATKDIMLCDADFNDEDLGDVLLSVVKGKARYVSRSTVRVNGLWCKLVLEEVCGQWKIVCEADAYHGQDFRRILWEVSFGGFNCDLPPLKGWKPVHSSASGNPTIEYLYN